MNDDFHISTKMFSKHFSDAVCQVSSLLLCLPGRSWCLLDLLYCIFIAGTISSSTPGTLCCAPSSIYCLSRHRGTVCSIICQHSAMHTRCCKAGLCPLKIHMSDGQSSNSSIFVIRHFERQIKLYEAMIMRPYDIINGLFI